ncbi:MAG: M20/M25/M40 family metallo-hydrolase [Gemmatimonadales bacterium]
MSTSWGLKLASALLALNTSLAFASSQQNQSLTAHQQLGRDIYRQLIEINTTHSVGSTTDAAKAMAARLRDAGIPAEDIRLFEPHPGKGNLVVRFRGSGQLKPILLLAHLDVVEALESDWSFDPFQFREQDGYFYGRGTADDKAMAAIWVANLIRYKREGFTPARDIIVALTADEEGGDHNGVDWLLRNHRELIEAEYALNEGGEGELRDGRRIVNEIQASEKVYQTFHLRVTNPGGHSSVPTKDNAIYHLSEGLTRLAAYDFPVVLNEITAAYFDRMSKIESGEVGRAMAAVVKDPGNTGAVRELSHSPYFNALLRTTCVATMLDAGHAENALPQTANATVNCRVLPGESIDEVERTLVRVLDDPAIKVTRIGVARPSDPSPLTPELVATAERITDEMWPGVGVLPTMVTGATDGLYLRNAGIPTYGLSGIFLDMDDLRMHGKDERVSVKSFYDGLEFLYRVVKSLSSGPSS